METKSERLRRDVAKILCASRSALTRTDILAKLDTSLLDGNTIDVDRVSVQLNVLKKNAHVAMAWGNKWEITPRGRSFWSAPNDEKQTMENKSQAADETVDTTNSAQSDATNQTQPLVPPSTAQTSPRTGTANMAPSAAYTVEFNMNDPDDAALARIVNTVREAIRAPAIERKAEKLALLAQYSNNPLILPEHRSVFFDIRYDLAKLEDIA